MADFAVGRSVRAVGAYWSHRYVGNRTFTQDGVDALPRYRRRDLGMRE